MPCGHHNAGACLEASASVLPWRRCLCVGVDVLDSFTMLHKALPTVVWVWPCCHCNTGACLAASASVSPWQRCLSAARSRSSWTRSPQAWTRQRCTASSTGWGAWPGEHGRGCGWCGDSLPRWGRVAFVHANPSYDGTSLRLASLLLGKSSNSIAVRCLQRVTRRWVHICCMHAVL